MEAWAPAECGMISNAATTVERAKDFKSSMFGPGLDRSNSDAKIPTIVINEDGPSSGRDKGRKKAMEEDEGLSEYSGPSSGAPPNEWNACDSVNQRELSIASY